MSESTDNSTVDSKSTPASKKPASKKPASKTASKGSRKSAVSLGQAQSQANANMDNGSASLEQVHSFLSKKANKGKYFGPGQIAVGIGEGCTDKSVRKAMQRAGLAKGKNAVIAAPGDKDWLALHKAGNRNTYCSFPAGSNPPAAQ